MDCYSSRMMSCVNTKHIHETISRSEIVFIMFELKNGCCCNSTPPTLLWLLIFECCALTLFARNVQLSGICSWRRFFEKPPQLAVGFGHWNFPTGVQTANWRSNHGQIILSGSFFNKRRLQTRSFVTCRSGKNVFINILLYVRICPLIFLSQLLTNQNVVALAIKNFFFFLEISLIIRIIHNTYNLMCIVQRSSNHIQNQSFITTFPKWDTYMQMH